MDGRAKTCSLDLCSRVRSGVLSLSPRELSSFVSFSNSPPLPKKVGKCLVPRVPTPRLMGNRQCRPALPGVARTDDGNQACPIKFPMHVVPLDVFLSLRRLKPFQAAGKPLVGEER